MTISPLVRSLLCAAALTLALAGCQKSEAPKPETPTGTVAPAKDEAGAAKPAEAPQHGKPGAEPGSHEDWCGEHAVPESQCTRCNAKLIPAFKATGDWCDDHGLPKSQCLTCNPDLKIERPPKQG